MENKKLEVIKKLIQLANKNPNENEANLAARKVCTMLADYNFNTVVTPNFKSASNPSSDPIVEWMEERMKKKRSNQPPNTGDWSRVRT